MSNNEKVLNSNEALVRFTSDYEYVLGAQMGRTLDFVGLFHSADFMIDQIEQIRYDLEETAKYYAAQQGLAPGEVGWGVDGWDEHGQPYLRINTGTLYNGIKAIRTGQSVHLRSEARDKYGHYYGGHVEFGHQKVPPRPHLRPALYTVSEASRGKLRSALHNLLTSGFSGNSTYLFGTGGGLSSSYYRKGAGNVKSFLSTGTRKREAKYHFGSMRNNLGKNLSRKGQNFRQSSKSTAKKTMGWKKQKSLNETQRKMYRNRDSRRSVRNKSKSITERLKKAGYSGKRLQNEKNRQMRRFSDSKRLSSARKQRMARKSASTRKAVVQHQKNLRAKRLYYAQNYLKFTGHYGNSYTQKVNYKYSEKAQKLASEKSKESKPKTSTSPAFKSSDFKRGEYINPFNRR